MPTSPTQGVSTLWALQASAATLTPGDSVWWLTMVDPGTHVTEFADRPVRAAWSVPLAELVDRWPDAFADAAPNAALTAIDLRGDAIEPTVLVLGPPHATEQGFLRFPVTFVNAAPSAPTTAVLTDVGLFIDPGAAIAPEMAQASAIQQQAIEQAQEDIDQAMSAASDTSDLPPSVVTAMNAAQQAVDAAQTQAAAAIATALAATTAGP